MAQTLDESVRLTPVAFGYALVRDTLPEVARAHIEKYLLSAAADVIRGHRMGIHNVQCWKNSAVGLVGLAANRQTLMREAIDDPDRGFRVQVTKGVTDDGLWYEGSLGYHRYTMDALWPLAVPLYVAARAWHSQGLVGPVDRCQEVHRPFDSGTPVRLGKLPGDFLPSKDAEGLDGLDKACEPVAIADSGGNRPYVRGQLFWGRPNDPAFHRMTHPQQLRRRADTLVTCPPCEIG
jgi:hypothetical protein